MSNQKQLLENLDELDLMRADFEATLHDDEKYRLPSGRYPRNTDMTTTLELAKPIRVQLSRKKGWRMPPDTVSVARPGRWGNLYSVERYGRERAILLFRNTLEGYWTAAPFDNDPDELMNEAYACHMAFRKRHAHDTRYTVRYYLAGKNLACWCPLDQPCHADVLLEIANA